MALSLTSGITYLVFYPPGGRVFLNQHELIQSPLAAAITSASDSQQPSPPLLSSAPAKVSSASANTTSTTSSLATALLTSVSTSVPASTSASASASTSTAQCQVAQCPTPSSLVHLLSSSASASESDRPNADFRQWCADHPPYLVSTQATYGRGKATLLRLNPDEPHLDHTDLPGPRRFMAGLWQGIKTLRHERRRLLKAVARYQRKCGPISKVSDQATQTIALIKQELPGQGAMFDPEHKLLNELLAFPPLLPLPLLPLPPQAHQQPPKPSVLNLQQFYFWNSQVMPSQCGKPYDIPLWSDPAQVHCRAVLLADEKSQDPGDPPAVVAQGIIQKLQLPKPIHKRPAQDWAEEEAEEEPEESAGEDEEHDDADATAADAGGVKRRRLS
jgi:hypothetical protein